MARERLYLFETTLRDGVASLPSPRLPGEGAERRRREAGEGASQFLRKSRRPLTRPAFAKASADRPLPARGER